MINFCDRLIHTLIVSRKSRMNGMNIHVLIYTVCNGKMRCKQSHAKITASIEYKYKYVFYGNFVIELIVAKMKHSEVNTHCNEHSEAWFERTLERKSSYSGPSRMLIPLCAHITQILDTYFWAFASAMSWRFQYVIIRLITFLWLLLLWY